MPINPVSGKINPQDINNNLSYLDSKKVGKDNLSIHDINRNFGKLDETYMSDSFLQQMAGTTPIHSTPANDTITLDKVTFKNKSTNLYNKETSTQDAYVNNSDGTLISSTGFIASDYIIADEGVNYIIKRVRHIAYYDSQFNFLSGDSDTTMKSNYVITPPANAEYVRFSWSESDLSDEQQMNQGSTLLAYEPYYIKIGREYIDRQEIVNTDINFDAVSFENTNFLLTGKNLFNPNEVSYDYYVNWNTGELASSTSYNASGHIPVKPLTDYASTHSGHIAYYNKQKEYISGVENSSTQFTTPDDCYYIRMSFGGNNDVNAIQIEEGTSSTEFEPFTLYIQSLSSSATKSVLTTIPPKIYALNNEEVSVWLKNLVNDNNIQFDLSGSLGMQTDAQWKGTPTVAGVEEISYSTYKDNQQVGGGVAEIISVDDIVSTDSILIMGDSTTDGNDITNPLLTEYSNRGSTVNLIGTRGNGHEGRSGWTLANYVNLGSKSGVTNAFWNPNTLQFDFSYYMTQTGFATPNMFLIVIGINDIFGAETDEEVNNIIDAMILDYDEVISSIHAYDPNIKIGISLIMPPNASQDAFGQSYGLGQTQWRYKRNQLILNDRIGQKFANRESEQIYLLSLMHHLDPSVDINDGVHPNATGNEKIADQIYAFMRNVV